MKHSSKVAAVVTVAAIIAIAWALLSPTSANSQEIVATSTPEIVYVDKPTLSPAQIIWLAHLMQCESGIRKTAVNKVDLDGTSSIGLLQFKQGTFDHYLKEYSLTGDIYDGNAQVAIVTEWILHPGTVDWAWQFPDCVRTYGLPPVK